MTAAVWSSRKAGAWMAGEPGLTVPEGIRLVYLPPYTPELQPAETLWTLVDEPIVNKHITDLVELEKIVAKQCVDLANAPERIRSQTQFHWRPATTKSN